MNKKTLDFPSEYVSYDPLRVYLERENQIIEFRKKLFSEADLGALVDIDNAIKELALLNRELEENDANVKLYIEIDNIIQSIEFDNSINNKEEIYGLLLGIKNSLETEKFTKFEVYNELLEKFGLEKYTRVIK